MIRKFLILMLTCACIVSRAQVNIITTIAGTGIEGYGGDGGPGLTAQFRYPSQSCIDKFGNLYIADDGNNRVRMLNLSTGIVTTVAGKGIGGMGSYSGDEGPATAADLWIPDGLCVDTMGNLYIADGLNNRIRKVTVSTGIITTVVGNGIAGSSGDGGVATNAAIHVPAGVAIDKFGNIYVCEAYGNKLRKIDATTHVINTIAGTGINGYSGDGGPATNAKLDEPGQPIIDSIGNVIFSDGSNNVIRKIDVTTGIITTIAGTGVAGYSGNGGLAIHAQLNGPYGMCFLGDSCILFSEYWNGVIRKVNLATGIISTVAGIGTMGYSGDGGPAANAKLIPDGVVVDKHGNLIISDYDNQRIRKVYSNVGVSETAMSSAIVIYPNPASKDLTVEHAENGIISIFNMLGQEVFKAAIKSNIESFNLNELMAGNYVLRIIEENGGSYSQRLTIIK